MAVAVSTVGGYGISQPSDADGTPWTDPTKSAISAVPSFTLTSAGLVTGYGPVAVPALIAILIELRAQSVMLQQDCAQALDLNQLRADEVPAAVSGTLT